MTTVQMQHLVHTYSKIIWNCSRTTVKLIAKVKPIKVSKQENLYTAPKSTVPSAGALNS